jgi:hypothetical protein
MMRVRDEPRRTSQAYLEALARLALSVYGVNTPTCSPVLRTPDYSLPGKLTYESSA